MDLQCWSHSGLLLWLFITITMVSGEFAKNSTDVEASVEEVQKPTMTVENGDMTDYRLPGYYPFNNGEPFFLEKDPLTGAIDFSKKTPITGYAGASDFSPVPKQDRVTGQEKADVTESEYYEDEEVSTTDQDFKEDGIDRKDGNIDGYRPNDIDKNPFKISADLHQFLNLPVHYSTSGKFPLISSSYANTKIQGTGGNSVTNNSNNGVYSNHKYVTSSTQAPSYYTFKLTTTTTPRPTTTPHLTTPFSVFTTNKPKTTSKPAVYPTKLTTFSSTTTTTPSTTTKLMFSEYNEGEDLVYSDYDMEYSQPHNSHGHPPSTISKAPPSIFKPTVIPISDEHPTRKPVQNFTEQEEEYEEEISIVTSLPVDVYYSQHTQSTTLKPSTTFIPTQVTTPKPTTTTEQLKETSASTTTTSTTTEAVTKPSTTVSTVFASSPTTKLSTAYNELYKPTTNNNFHFYGTKDHFEPMIDEPFRPIFGPHDNTGPSTQLPITHKPQLIHNEVKVTPAAPIKPYFEYHAPSNAKPLPNHGKIEFVERIPSVDQTNKYVNKPGSPPKYPGVEPPRPNPPLVFSNQGFNDHPQDQFNKQPVLPPQGNQPPFNNNDKQNLNVNPVRIPPQHESINYGRPQGSNIPGPGIQDLGVPLRNPPAPPQNQRPFIRLPDEVPFYIKKHTNGSVTKIPKPEEIIYPQQRPVGVIPPAGLKPEAKPTNQVVKFHPPMKQDNHFIKVPVDEENPSYSLQTSFSIGMPGDGPGDKDNEKKTSQGVGQVLFPDGSVDTSLQGDKDKPNQGPPIRNRPPNTRPYITTYNQNNIPPQPRPQPPSTPLSSQILPQRPASQRHPVPELRPPKPNGGENYPRPHWENHPKPHIHFNSQHNSGPKQDVPPPFPPINRIKPDANLQRPDLPNILPQFRPNAKVGSNEFSMNVGNSERLREPMDILQPPPLPQPQHLRVNRNDDSGIIDEIDKSFEKIEPTQPPLVHRRTGPQPVNRVTTLQMMQQGPPRRNLIRNEYHDNRPEKPVYLVYPANEGSKQQMQSQASEGVVVGTRGPHQPVPPNNLKTTVIDKEDDLDPFPLDDEKQFSIPKRDRVDTPVLKTKTPTKPALKNDFPYEILKPKENIVLPEERIMAGSSATKEYNAFSPTVSSSTEDIKDPDAEINLIPYLQDYMPFATKKPIAQKPGSILSSLLNVEKNPDFIKLPSTIKPISVTLNTKMVTTVKPETSSEYIKNSKPVLPPLLPHDNMAFSVTNGGGKNEYTVGAVMHTNFVKKPVNHRPFEIPSSNQPKPVDLEAPFQASLSAPESQGWTVVKNNSEKRNQDVDRYDSESEDEKKHVDATEQKFDFDNFKPQLFGGFKPIIPSSDEKTEKSNESNPDKNSGRQEKTHR